MNVTKVNYKHSNYNHRSLIINFEYVTRRWFLALRNFKLRNANETESYQWENIDTRNEFLKLERRKIRDRNGSKSHANFQFPKR